MTWLGKILVFANFAFGVVLLGWAAMIYANRVDFTSKGELGKRDARIKELYASLTTTEARYKGARAVLLDRERQRPEHMVWYDRQLKDVRFGPGGNKAAPVLTVASKDGLRPIDDPRNAGRPLLAAATDRLNQPLFSLAFYADDLAATRKQIELEQTRLTKAVDDDAKLTQELIGDKGVRQRLFNEQAKKASVETELKSLDAPRVNTLVEEDLLEQRGDQLRRRVEELNKSRATGARP